MPRNRLHTPYRERILLYCEENGIEVPNDFDKTQSSESIVAIDISIKPAKLFHRSTHIRKEVYEFLQSPESINREYLILDFKRGYELNIEGERLVNGRSFEYKKSEEQLYLVES